jgi:hypothetical protein
MDYDECTLRPTPAPAFTLLSLTHGVSVADSDLQLLRAALDQLEAGKSAGLWAVLPKYHLS